MFPVNHLPPEQMPAHQRDFPARSDIAEQDVKRPLDPRASYDLVLMVACYLLAMFGGILVLGALTPIPQSSSAVAIHRN